MKYINYTIVRISTKVLYPNRFWTIILSIFILTTACEDFVQIDPPDGEIAQKMVFASDETAISAMDAVYHNLQYSGFSSGRINSITILCETSSDILNNFTTSITGAEFYQNNITPDNSHNLDLWISLYKRIYEVNAILEGVEESSVLSGTVEQQLQGEAKFIRAFSYFYLTNLYGRVPLILGTAYQTNAVMTQSEPSEIYDQIIADLLDSEALLENDYHGDLRTRINKGTVRAMLARVYLYLEKWELAERYATLVIDDPLYILLPDLDQVFLMDSMETIWHLLPVDSNYNTFEGYFLILTQTPEAPITQFSFALSNTFQGSLEMEDTRRQHWIGRLETGSHTYYYPFKYKIKQDSNLLEYAVVFRLAEQYLIRAEARTRIGADMVGAIADVDRIRNRAELSLIAETNPEIGQEQLLEVIWNERKIELFAEWGHRWLDLKRTRRIGAVLSAIKPDWEDNKALFPIPEHELLNNPFLDQNDGY